MVSFGLTTAASNRLRGAVVLLKPYMTQLAPVWAQMTDKQKQDYREHSPLFASILDLMRPFKDVM